MDEFFAQKLKERRDLESGAVRSSYVQEIFPPIFWRRKSLVPVQRRAVVVEEMPVAPAIQAVARPVLTAVSLPDALVQFRHYLNSIGKAKVVFVTDFLVADQKGDEVDSSVPLDLSVSFPKAEAVLFHKMIQAMKLNLGDYRITATRLSALSQRDDYLEHARAEIIDWAPQCVITLGAVALEALAPRQGKLSKLHGQFLNIEGIPLVPIFHPQFLLINQEMKKTAWADMQKVMEMLELK